MTTQWNPAQAHGDAGADDAADEARDRVGGHPEPGAGGGEHGRQDEAPPHESGPWRGYTMPVPETPYHTVVPGTGAEEPSYDGISGYPDPSRATAPWRAREEDDDVHDPVDAPESSESPAGDQEPQGSPRHSGRHARSAVPAARPRRDGARDGNRDSPRDDDPEGLAGWVGSLAEAAEDAQIAGRSTGSFPIVSSSGSAPVTEPVEGLGAEAREGDGVPRPRQHGRREQAASEEGPGGLPRRVPGPSAVSGAFRAIGPDAKAPASGSAAGSERASGSTVSDGEDEEYRPTTHEHWRPMKATTRAELIERLDALSTLTEFGQGDLPEDVLAHATQLLDHAGARLRLSGEHTVVALAGGTGSGKSSLFNALCGLELSQIGVTRPTTSNAHACVWGHEGADALLSWLGVPTRYRHSRTSVLDAGNSELTGLVLLDLPDHDSVRSVHTAEADRLIGSVDLLVWVLDPQKYADAAVHHRYLAKMAGHGAVTIAVLNQVDKVASDELEELLTDLRRLLETESGVHPRVITTSTVTGEGISDVREFLGGTVRDRRALVDRLVADLDQIVQPFEEFRGEGEIPEAVPDEVRGRVQDGLAGAAGVTAVADVTETNDIKRGKRRVGWPVIRGVEKMRKDPLAAVQLDFLRRDSDQSVGGPVDAHEAELDKVLGEAADAVSDGMPSPWRRRMRAAARSGISELPAELGEAVDGAVGDPESNPAWWKSARAVQYALLSVAGLGLMWAIVALLSWLGGGITNLRMFDAPVFVAYAAALVAAALLVGWLTGVGCGNLVEVAAVQHRENVERAAKERVREVAGSRVVEPMETELARYRAFRAAYEVARPSS